MHSFSGRNYIRTGVIILTLVIVLTLVLCSVEISMLPAIFFLAGLIYLFILTGNLQPESPTPAEAVICTRGPPKAF